jgi:hypothetical protein
MIQPADPGYGSFDSNAEAGVGTEPYLRRSRYPWEAASGRVVLFDALRRQVVAVDALGAADDPAVALR